ncbi:MAG: dicarboxylate/amino acid:cation symporter [Gammaproteobacteria bacterium]|nr:dicarboxylate/amino acid:cation symporter [Gammaproteobacteria bacterium]
MRIKLHWQILIAIVLAGFAGYLFPQFLAVYEFVGRLFINALKMIIVPLVTASIIIGVAGLGSGEHIGRLGLKTVSFYVVTTLSAILVGLVLVNVFQPGLDNGEPVKELLSLSASSADVQSTVGDKGWADVVEVFVRMIPSNIIEAAGDNGRLLALIFFSILFGFFMTRLDHVYAEHLFNFWDAVYQVMMMITELVMKTAPLGVFGLIAAVVAKQIQDLEEKTGGLDAIASILTTLGHFALVVLGALLIHILVTLPLLLKFVGKIKPYKMFPAMAESLLAAFSTASSSATLPITMDCARDKAGVSSKVASFVLPLGATVNMNGTALYECVAVIFLAQAYGVELSIATQLIIVVVALLTSIGVAGVPAASLVAITIILTVIGMPAEAIGVLFITDRILDMARTSTNVFGDACCAVIVARLEGEDTNLT